MNIAQYYSRTGTFMLGVALMTALVVAAPCAMAQDEVTTTGTVASSSRSTLTIRNSSGNYQLFLIDTGTRRPAQLTPGTAVRVISTAGDEPGVRYASQITVGDAAAPNQTGTDNAVVPQEVRRLEQQIERQARRLQLGVRAGFALDPELVLIGAQVQVGPFFSPNVFFRPNIEFGFGEVTTLFALNPDVIYQLPLTSRSARWNTYVGAGPGFNFTQVSFKRPDGSGKRIDFGEFSGDVALNIIGGVRYRSGMFAEMRTSIYSNPSPTLRLVLGYSF